MLERNKETLNYNPHISTYMEDEDGRSSELYAGCCTLYVPELMPYIYSIHIINIENLCFSLNIYVFRTNKNIFAFE